MANITFCILAAITWETLIYSSITVIAAIIGAIIGGIITGVFSLLAVQRAHKNELKRQEGEKKEILKAFYQAAFMEE